MSYSCLSAFSYDFRFNGRLIITHTAALNLRALTQIALQSPPTRPPCQVSFLSLALWSLERSPSRSLSVLLSFKRAAGICLQMVKNRIKAQAQEHEKFRRLCISFAQSVHRVDMRLRLGLLQDAKSIERQIAREAAEVQAKKHKLEIPTVKTEAQTKADEAAAVKTKEKGAEKPSKAAAVPKPKIRPLSESKAIDSGATFVSESFLFMVGLSLILFENWRSRRKETSRREDVADRINELEERRKVDRKAIVELEKEILRLRAKTGKGASAGRRIIPKELWDSEAEEQQEEVQPQGWFSWIRGGQSQAKAVELPEVAEVSEVSSLPHPPPPPSSPAGRQPLNSLSSNGRKSNDSSSAIPSTTSPQKEESKPDNSGPTPNSTPKPYSTQTRNSS